MALHLAHAFQGHRGAVYALHPLVDRRCFLSGGSDGHLVRWDSLKPELGVSLATLPTPILSICLLPEGCCVLGDMEGKVWWLTLNEPREITRVLAHHRKGVFVLHQVEGNLYSAGGDGYLTRWCPQQMLPQESVQVSHQSVRSLAYHPGRDEFALGCSEGAIRFVDRKTLQVQASWRDCHVPSVFTLTYTEDGTRLLSGGRDAQLKVWQRDNGKQANCIAAHRATLNHLLSGPGNDFLFTASRDHTIRIWNQDNLELRQTLRGHTHSVNRLLWLDQPGILLSASDDSRIIGWIPTAP